MDNWNRFRDPELAQRIVREIHSLASRQWAIMEVCGGQTHAIFRYGLDQLLPPEVELIHGPGCPVCVTPIEAIDRALAIAQQPNVIFCTFGDMLRVPGTCADLQRIKAAGADIRVLYSPLDSLTIARNHPNREVVFFGIGFETTAPAHALTLHRAAQEGLSNFSMLTSLVRVPPALEALLREPDNRVQGILAAGHVCAVMGLDEYPPIAEQHQVPIVVTGFEPLDLLEGIRRVLVQLEAGQFQVENAYGRAVTRVGNPAAQGMIAKVYEVADRYWRGIGTLPNSGWRIREKYRSYDADYRFQIDKLPESTDTRCLSGQVLRGRLKPSDCPEFGRSCTPRTPLGATMVSAEGACSAYYQAGKSLGLIDRTLEVPHV